MDETPIGKFVHALARYTAIAGGAVMIVITVTTVISIIGRILIPFGLSPIPGDFEIVQAGMLFAIFSFLPWCHLERGHAIVAVLTDKFPVRFNAVVEFVWDIAMLLVALFITWRLWFGMLDKFGNKESTFILRLPLWISYATGVFGALILIVVAAYCVARSGRNAFSANPVRPASEVAE